MVFSGTVMALLSKLVYMKPHPFPLSRVFSVQAAQLWWATQRTGDGESFNITLKNLNERSRGTNSTLKM